MKKILSLFVLSFVAMVAFAVDTETVIFDGSVLTSTATTADTEFAFGDFTVVMSKGAKLQASSGENKFTKSAILIGKQGAYLYNKTAFPGKIVKFEVYANSGASKKVTVGVNFSNEPITAYDASSQYTFAENLGTLDNVYDLTNKLADDTRYFWYQVTNSNNSQVQFRITYELPAGVVKAPEFSVAKGDYYEVQNVALTAAEGADIYYSFDGETYTKYESAINIAQDATLYAYAQQGDKKSDISSTTYRIAKTYASLTDLCQVEPAGQPVIVTLKKEEIVDIYVTKTGYRNGIYVMAGDKKLEIFCYDVPDAWQIGGLVTGTLKGAWKNYNGQWEVCPSTWNDLTYSEYPTSLQNGQFNAADAVTVGICTYDYDMSKNGTTYYGHVPVTGWEIPANGSARAAGVFQYGSGAWLGGNAFACPATDKDGSAEGACLGVVGVWGGTAQYTQQVKLPAGYYTLSCYVLNTAGAKDFTNNLIGVSYMEEGELQEFYDSRKSYTLNEWTKVVVPFQLNAETVITVSLGYQGSNIGSLDAQHLFIDNVKVEEGLQPILAAAVNNCKQVIAAKANVGEALFQYPEEAFNALVDATAKAEKVANKMDAENSEYKAALIELDKAVETYEASLNAPSKYKDFTLQLEGAEGFLGFADGGVRIVKRGGVRFIPAEDNEFYISSSDGTKYVGYLGTNTWSMTADANYKAAFTIKYVDGKYTIEGVNGYLGVDNYTVGSPFYGNKAATFQFVLKEKVVQSDFIKGTTQTIAVERTKGMGATATVVSYDAAKVCEALGISDITEAEVFGIESNAGYSFKSAKWIEEAADEYAGWRNLNGEFCDSESDGASVCVTIEKKASDNITITTKAENEPAVTAPKYNAYWALATVGKAVLINTQITFVEAEGDNATAISSVEGNDVKAAQVYDLTGRQAKTLNRGQIYIINGKKMMLK